MLVDIKDMSPNPELIEELERMLAYAKEGKIRSMVSICGWYDDAASTGWALDQRNGTTRMLGAITLAQFDLATHIRLNEEGSILRSAITGE